METKKWVDNGGTCTHTNIPAVYDTLPPHVYELKFNNFTSEFYLDRLFEKFNLSYKIYDLEEDLLARIKNSFVSHNKNFGVLFKGLKGTGKTVAAKLLSNELGLPVILITTPYTDMGSFINNIHQDVIVLFDEFEKVYSFHEYGNDEKDSLPNLMTLMDGVFTSNYKRLFILTTNREYLPDSMLARPSRIRYVKSFSDLSVSTIKKVLDDMVQNKNLIPQLLDLIQNLEIITIDIVKSMAEEANLFNRADAEFFSVFNLKKIDKEYTVTKITIEGGIEKKQIINGRVPHSHLDEEMNLTTDWGEYVGMIRAVDFDKKIVTVVRNDNEDGEVSEENYVFTENTNVHYAFL